MSDGETEPPSVPAPWKPNPLYQQASTTGDGDVHQAGGNIVINYEAAKVYRTKHGREAREIPCPYPGLMPFGTEHEDWFHGRGQMTSDVLDRMDARMRAGGPLMLIGPSGAGKSSLLAAGVIPALRDGRLPGSSEWSRLMLTPTASPAMALAAAFGEGTNDINARAKSWRADSAQCVAELNAESGLLLVVDQFEEVFTACADEAERQWFVGVLDLLAKPEVGAAVVLSLRADFYESCTAYPQLRAALQAGPVLLGPMSAGELKQAIELPAQSVRLKVQEGLVELLLADLGAAGGLAGAGSAGRLPLLAHALRATWQQRSGHLLTVDGYRLTGGIQRALANTADRLFDPLPPSAREMARWVFLRLVTVGRDADDTRRRVRYDELLKHAPDPESAKSVVDDFTRDRLLTRDQDSVTITHEVLIRAWPRLRDWIEQDRDGNLVRQDLEEAAADWERADQEPAALYGGSRLEIAQAWAEKHPADLSLAARTFLATAERQQRRGQRLRRIAVTVITLLAVTASTAAVFAFVQNARAVRDRNQAVDAATASSSQQLAPTNSSLSAQLALAAYRMNPSAQATSRLITTENTPMDIRLAGSKGSAYTVAYSPDGHTVAAGYVYQKIVQLWDVSNPSHPVKLGSPLPEDSSVDSILSLAFSPDGRTLAVGGHSSSIGDNGSGGFVDLWDLTSPSHPVRLERAPTPAPRSFDFFSSVESLAFSSDGRTLAAGRASDDVTIWNVSKSGDLTLAGKTLFACTSSANPFLAALSFSPDGHTLATTCNGANDDSASAVALWNTADPAHPTLRGQPLAVDKTVDSVAFSPDGHTLAAGSKDSDVHLWNVTDPDHPGTLGKALTGPANPVLSVAFSPDGHTLAAGSADNAVYLWNVTDLKTITPLGRPLTSPGVSVTAVAFSPDSHTLVAGNGDGAVNLWELPSTQLVGGGGAVNSVAFSPDGRVMAAGNQSRTVSLWNTTDPGHPTPLGAPLTGPGQSVDSVAFSPDGRTLAAGDTNGDVTLWNVTDPGHPMRLGPPLTGVNGAVLSLAFSRDGKTLAAAGDHYLQGQINLWNVSDPASPESLGDISTDHTTSIESISFSPNGHILATGGDTSTHEVGLWSTTSLDQDVRISEPISEPTGISTWVSFSPDGKTLATGNSNGVITLWNTTDPSHPVRRGKPLTVPGGSLWSIAFSPDGRTLAAAGHTSVGTIALWNVSDPDHPTAIGEPLTTTTGAVSVLAFSPDSHTLAATTDDGVATVWDLKVGFAINNICGHSEGALTSKNWSTYVPVLGYRSPCGSP